MIDEPIVRMALRHLGYPEDNIAIAKVSIASYYPESPSALPMSYIVTLITYRDTNELPGGYVDTPIMIDVVKLTLIDDLVIHHTLYHGFDGLEWDSSIPGPDDSDAYADLYRQWNEEEYP